jgi:hypothetical protein
LPIEPSIGANTASRPRSSRTKSSRSSTSFRARGAPDALDNLALACACCNLSKAAAQAAQVGASGQTVALFNPRLDDWSTCFEFVLEPTAERVLIEGKNATGRATVARLRMNTRQAARARWKWFLAYALEAEYLSD